MFARFFLCTSFLIICFTSSACVTSTWTNAQRINEGDIFALQKSAASGDAVAQYLLGKEYDDADYFYPPELDKAIYWYEKEMPMQNIN